MRVSNKVKAERHEKIIEEASRLFRGNGIEATGVADVMAAAGLTHGGFYRHFKSKDELAVVALNAAFNKFTAMLEDDIKEKDAGSAVRAYIENYLSMEHVKSRAQGCPIAALGPETEQSSPAIQATISQGIAKATSLIAQGIAAKTQQASKSKASGLLSLLVGTLIMARAANTDDDAEQVLQAGRELAMNALKQ